MRIAYVAFVRIPTEKAHGAQIAKTCEALVAAGASVTLFVPGRATRIKDDLFCYYGVRRTLDLLALKVPDLVRYGRIGFALSMLLFAEAVKWRKEFRDADIIYSRDAFVLLQYLLLGRRLVYEAHMTPTGISRFVARRAYRVVAISQGLKDAYVRTGVRDERIVVAHDAVDPAPFKEQYDSEQVRRDLGMPIDTSVALYVGKVDDSKGVPTFAAASELLKEIVVVIIGAGLKKDALAARYPKALFLPETPYRDLARVLCAADILVLPNSAKDTDTALYTSPLKAFAYLAAGKPILASDVPALREVLEGRARFFAPDDPAALARALQEPFPPLSPTNPDRYSWDTRARVILEAL